MRYWIYWNDLVQGPFELDELVALRAFSETLEVCAETSQTWYPAASYPEFAAALERLRSPRGAPPPPPPPPPSRPPQSSPLQGEFFHDAAGQQQLFDNKDPDKGLFSYVPADRLPEGTSVPLPVTMPFHFSGSAATALIEAPAPIKVQPVIEPVETPPPLPVDVFELPSVTIPKPRLLKESPVPIEYPTEDEVLPEREEAQVEPEPLPEPVVETPVVAPPERIELPPLERETFELEPAATATTPEEFEAPPLKRSLGLLPWIAGTAAIVFLLISIGYWLMDRYSSRAAIAEVNRHRMEKPRPVTVTPPAVVPAPVVVVPPPPAPVVKKKDIPKPVKVVAKPKAQPPAPEPKKKPVVEEAPKPAPVAKPVPPAPPKPVDVFANRFNDAINAVMNQVITGKRTIGQQAKMMLEEMHEKELLHAADTGERLYLPDKIQWSALREEGPRYRVYLNFSALQASGERVQTRSYQFTCDLDKSSVDSDDNATRQDFFSQVALKEHQHNPMIEDIESLLGGVDTYNKHKMRAIIVQDNRRNKSSKKDIEAAMASALQKLRRTVVYFRTRYPEKALENLGKAYQFASLLKEKS